ncbi:hypothetical protein [Pseudophaeobacter sp.]|uniref:hypothetical protein n=1 Tax=Pseudophaeobacter sp. TaxID=1971739 RepID=UPI0032D948D8
METWCGFDLHHDDFWDVSLREYHLITSGKIKAKNEEFKAHRVLNQELGILVKFAYHSPNKMPDFTKAKAEQKRGSGEKKADHSRLHQYLLNQSFQSK